MARKKSYFRVRYSDGTRFVTTWKPRKGHRAETGAKVKSVTKIKKPSRWQKFISW